MQTHFTFFPSSLKIKCIRNLFGNKIIKKQKSILFCFRLKSYKLCNWKFICWLIQNKFSIYIYIYRSFLFCNLIFFRREIGKKTQENIFDLRRAFILFYFESFFFWSWSLSFRHVRKHQLIGATARASLGR